MKLKTNKDPLEPEQLIRKFSLKQKDEFYRFVANLRIRYKAKRNFIKLPDGLSLR